MSDPKKVLEEALGPMSDFERALTEKVEAARDFAEKGEALLRSIRGDRPVTLNPNRYRGMVPRHALLAFFNSPRGRPLTEQEIIDELLSGNVKTGAKTQSDEKKTWNIKQALPAQIKTKVLKQHGDKYGLPDWDNSLFK